MEVEGAVEAEVEGVVEAEAEVAVEDDAVEQVEAETKEDLPAEMREPPGVTWYLLACKDPGTPGIIGSSNAVRFFDRTMTTRFMSGRSLGSDWVHRRPTSTHNATCSSSAVGFRTGSISSTLRP